MIEIYELANWFDCDHFRFVESLFLMAVESSFLMEDPVAPPWELIWGCFG